VTRTYTYTGARERAGIDPNKIASDEDFAEFLRRAAAYVIACEGRAPYGEVMLTASFGLVKAQTATSYMKHAVCPAGPLQPVPGNDRDVELRPETAQWRFDG